MQSAGGTGSCPPDETVFAVQYRRRIPLPHIWTAGRAPSLLCAADPFGLPNTEEVFL